MAELHRLEQSFAGVVLRIHQGITDMGRTVVATRLERESIALLEGEVHEAQWLPSANGIVSRRATRGAGALVILPRTLVDFHHRLNLRIPVAPIGTHARRAGMRSADAIKSLKILIKHLGVGRVTGEVAGRLRQTWKRPDAALFENDVTVAFGIRHAALIGERWLEFSGDSESVGRLLRQPPGILAAGAVIMVAATEPIHGGDVDRIAPHIFQRPVTPAVAGDFGMSVEFAADDLEIRAVDFRAVGAGAGDFFALFHSFGAWLRIHLQGSGRTLELR